MEMTSVTDVSSFLGRLNRKRLIYLKRPMPERAKLNGFSSKRKRVSSFEETTGVSLADLLSGKGEVELHEVFQALTEQFRREEEETKSQ